MVLDGGAHGFEERVLGDSANPQKRLSVPETCQAHGDKGGNRRTDVAVQRLSSLLELGDPDAEVAIAYRAKERLRDFYRSNNPVVARQMPEEPQHPASALLGQTQLACFGLDRRPMRMWTPPKSDELTSH